MSAEAITKHLKGIDFKLEEYNSNKHIYPEPDLCNSTSNNCQLKKKLSFKKGGSWVTVTMASIFKRGLCYIDERNDEKVKAKKSNTKKSDDSYEQMNYGYLTSENLDTDISKILVIIGTGDNEMISPGFSAVELQSSPSRKEEQKDVIRAIVIYTKMSDVDPQYKNEIFETACIDGDEDCNPALIEAIRTEDNVTKIDWWCSAAPGLGLGSIIVEYALLNIDTDYVVALIAGTKNVASHRLAKKIEMRPLQLKEIKKFKIIDGAKTQVSNQTLAGFELYYKKRKNGSLVSKSVVQETIKENASLIDAATKYVESVQNQEKANSAKKSQSKSNDKTSKKSAQKDEFDEDETDIVNQRLMLEDIANIISEAKEDIPDIVNQVNDFVEGKIIDKLKSNSIKLMLKEKYEKRKRDLGLLSQKIKSKRDAKDQARQQLELDIFGEVEPKKVKKPKPVRIDSPKIKNVKRVSYLKIKGKETPYDKLVVKNPNLKSNRIKVDSDLEKDFSKVVLKNQKILNRLKFPTKKTKAGNDRLTYVSVPYCGPNKEVITKVDEYGNIIGYTCHGTKTQRKRVTKSKSPKAEISFGDMVVTPKRKRSPKKETKENKSPKKEGKRKKAKTPSPDTKRRKPRVKNAEKAESDDLLNDIMKSSDQKPKSFKKLKRIKQNPETIEV